MSKLQLISLSAIVAVPAMLIPAPAMAQNSRVSEIIVYGTDPCPRSTEDEVVVCARKPESERYRIPEQLRQGGSLQSRQSWANRAIAFETHNRSGINSCTPVGPGGWTGCTQQIIGQAFRERGEQYQGDTAPRD